ncbi:MAG: aminotransferase class I/II-fold pyridoxal phosphate-dependent enzyme [Saprospiraceae bacterium]
MSIPVQLNLNVRGLQPSATLRINERCAELAREGQQVFRLGFGQSPFPVPEAVVEALKKHAHEKDYLPVKGLRVLREAISFFHNRHAGIHTTGDDVLVGPGSKELMFLLQMVYYGDLVIPRPSWVSYAPQARIASRHVYWLPTKQENSWLLTPEDLDKFCQKDPTRPRILILNYPANPTGATYSADKLEKMAAVARRYNVVVLSDEIYGEVHHEGAHVSISTYYPEGTIISSGLSKWCGAGGWRLGTFTFPAGLRWLLDAMAVAASETFTSTSTPIQWAAIKAFQGGPDIEHYLKLSRMVLKTVGQAVSSILHENSVGHAVPEGGFYLFPVFEFYREKLATRGIETSEEFCNRLLDETGVVLLPSSDFGFPEEFLGARLSYVDFDGAKALHLAGELEDGHAIGSLDLAEKFAPKVIKGVQRMVEWCA